MPRILIVGDLHGCLDELLELLRLVGFTPGADRLVSVGDLVLKGPRSGELVRFFQDGGHSSVLGNHDRKLLRILRRERAPGRVDVDELVARAGASRDDLIAWLESLPLFLDHDDHVVIHAGLDPRWAHPSEMTEPVLLTLRGWDTEADRPGDDRDRPWFELWPDDRLQGKLIVFGHWALRGLVVRGRFRGLDTGCCYGGRLSGWLFDEGRAAAGRLVSVPSRQPPWPGAAVGRGEPALPG